MTPLKIGDMCRLNNFIKTSLARHDEIGMFVNKRLDSTARMMTYWVLFYDKVRGPFLESELEVIRNNKNEDKNIRTKTLDS